MPPQRKPFTTKYVIGIIAVNKWQAAEVKSMRLQCQIESGQSVRLLQEGQTLRRQNTEMVQQVEALIGANIELTEQLAAERQRNRE